MVGSWDKESPTPEIGGSNKTHPGKFVSVHGNLWQHLLERLPSHGPLFTKVNAQRIFRVTKEVVINLVFSIQRGLMLEKKMGYLLEYFSPFGN